MCLVFFFLLTRRSNFQLLRSTYACLFVSQTETFDGDMNCDSLFVLACRSYGHLQVLQRLLTHPITSGLANFQYADQLGLENDTVTEESRGLITICVLLTDVWPRKETI